MVGECRIRKSTWRGVIQQASSHSAFSRLNLDTEQIPSSCANIAYVPRLDRLGKKSRQRLRRHLYASGHGRSEKSWFPSCVRNAQRCVTLGGRYGVLITSSPPSSSHILLASLPKGNVPLLFHIGHENMDCFIEILLTEWLLHFRPELSTFVSPP